MIRSFRHKGLERLFRRGDARGIPAQQAARIERMLDRLDAATRPSDMDVPGWRWHPLKGQRAGTWAVFLSGNWRLTYRFDGGDAADVDLEDYH